MAGHSKWANIKHRKGAQDAKRGKVFTRIIKEISVAVKESGSDPETNPRLRTAIANSKGANMPKDTVQRAIKKASGADADNYDEVTFEGYGPNGIAIFVECTTDNINRTVANIRAIFNKNGGSLGKNGELQFIFDRKGIFVIEKEQISMENDDFEMEMIDANAEEIEFEDNMIVVSSDFTDFGSIQSKLDELKITAVSGELQRIPNNTKKLTQEQSEKIFKIIDKFDDDDDVQNVYHNMEL